jgi:DMSO/TMAO reductase YedYZ molybdopterin-dependent catalytic subunit
MKMRSLIAALLLLLGQAGAPALAQSSCSPPAPPSFRVGGQVKTPERIDVPALQQLPHVNQNVTYFAAGQVENETFTGALLWDLLQSVGIVTDPHIKNDILRKIIIVTGTDGYVAVFTAGEIDPFFGGNQILLAYAVNGQALGCGGPAQIVAPGDKAGGRFVHNIATIIVEDESK